MPDSPLGRYGGRPIIKERPRVRDVGGTLHCGRQVQVCNDTTNPCIFDRYISSAFPPSISGDGLSDGHYLSDWIDDESSFHPCSPSQITPPNLPDLPTPSFTGIPSNCLTQPEPNPGAGWEQNWAGTGGIGVSMFPDVPGAIYTNRKCWRCRGGCGGKIPPSKEVVIKREAPKLAYYRSPIDINMIYEINESEYAFPLEPWVQRQSVLQSGLGVIPPPSDSPYTIHYPCPIYGKKSITKICKIKQGVFGDLLDMRQFSWGTAPFLTTEITRISTIYPVDPSLPRFTNPSSLYTGPSGVVNFTFTAENVVSPVTDIKIKNVISNAVIYPDYTLPTFLAYDPLTQKLTGTIPVPTRVIAEATNTANGTVALSAVDIYNEDPLPSGSPNPVPEQVDVYGQLPFINQDFYVYFPTASSVTKNQPTLGVNTWYMGNDIYIEAPNIVRSSMNISFWRNSVYYPTFNLPLGGVLLSGAWGYIPDTTTMFTINIYTSMYTPAGTYNIPMEMDLEMIPQALEPYWNDEPTKAQVMASPDAFRNRGPSPFNPGGDWYSNLVRNWPQIGNKIIYTGGAVSFEVTKATCPKPTGKSIRVIDRPDTNTNAFDVVGKAPSGSFYSFPDEP